MRKNIIIAAVVSIVLCATMSVSNEEAVSITAKPISSYVSSAHERVYIQVVIRIEPNPDNRNLIFESDSEDGEYNRKDVQLDGENAPRIFKISDPQYFGRGGFQLPPGHYKLRATVERSTDKNETASIDVTVTTAEEMGQEGR